MLHSIYDIIAYLGGANIVENASLKFNLLGHGSAASIYEHPSRPDMAIRVSDYPDGWFAYADNILTSDITSPYVPRPREIAYVDGTWIATVERLTECEEADMKIVDLMKSAICPAVYTVLSKEEEITLEAAAPDFIDHARLYLFGATDLIDSNFMRRGTQIVVNDPHSTMSIDYETSLK